MLHVERVAVIGTGLLGTSIGLALRDAGFRGARLGLGRRAETLEAARARGAFDVVTTDYAALSDGDLVVVAVHLGGFGEVFGKLARTGRRLVVTDVGSTKATVLRQARELLGPGQAFVGSHPMAGNEQQGPEGADATLFRGKPCVICNPGGDPGGDAGANAAAVAAVESLWRLLGMRLLRMEADTHDREVAAISHLPHLASVALVRVTERMGGWDVASSGFRDMTRLASSNPPMRADIVDANRDAIAEGLEALREELAEMAALVRAGDRAGLLETFERAQARRGAWLATRGEACGGEPS